MCLFIGPIFNLLIFLLDAFKTIDKPFEGIIVSFGVFLIDCVVSLC